LYFTSGLLRTEQTLKIICGAHVKKTVIPDLAEFNFGQFEMRGHEELKEKDAYRAWITDTTGEIGCPGGESKKQFEARILRGYAVLIKAIEQAVCDSAFVSCHGGTITSIMEHLVPGQKNFYEWQPQPGRGYTLSYFSGQFQGYAKI
jgi:alpha-ribazole phosphatase